MPNRKEWRAFYTVPYLKARCEITPEACWLWTGAKAANGYGLVGRNQTGSTVVHKVVYILTNGIVPEGMELDHLCRNRECCNPLHLEPVTHLENMRRGVSRCEKQTECIHGHPFIDGSYYVHGGKRICKECNSRKCRDYQERKKQKVAPLDLSSLFLDETRS